MKMILRSIAIFAFLASLMAPSARAQYGQRLSVGVGLIHLNHPSETDFEASGEYENMLSPFFGMGGLGTYIFASSAIAIVGVPEIFLHPLAGDWYISAAPIAEFGSDIGTHFGARLGTRIPLPLGVITFVPSFSVDFIRGGEDYILGFGLQI